MADISTWTEQQKNAYWAAQGVQLAPSAVGATQTGVGPNGVIIYDTASVAAGQAAAVAFAETDPEVKAALAALKAPSGDNSGKTPSGDSEPLPPKRRRHK